MQDMRTTIQEYRKGYDSLQARIDQLGEKITHARNTGAPVKELLDRRYLLYGEIAEMQFAISRMEEYLSPKG